MTQPLPPAGATPLFDYQTLFATPVDRKPWSATKWDKYAGTDILPFWIADMDFQSPPFIQEALQARLDHGIHGYSKVPADLTAAFLAWSAHYCNYAPDPSGLVWVPGVVASLNIAARALTAGTGADAPAIATTTPIYYPFLDVASNANRHSVQLPLTCSGSGANHRWEMDFDAMAHAVDKLASGRGQSVAALLFCNPHNPTGRVYTAAELEELAEFCLRRDITIISDEIHSPLVLEPDCRHLSIAALAPEVALKTITLQAPTKAWNLAGISASVAIIEDDELREKFRAARAGMISNVSPFAYAAAQAAYADQGPYLKELTRYLANNRDRLHNALNGVAADLSTRVEATYLSWIDVRKFPAIMAAESPAAWFEDFGLGLSNGAEFGGEGFVRFNFAAPAALVDEGIERLTRGLRAGR